jgi:putative ABC transport system substrate-binding protein
MQRRHAAIALLASAAALPRALRAQVAGPRIGWLRLHDRGAYAMVTERGFLDGLARAALVPGRNCTLVQRSAEGDSRRLRRLARELVAEKPDVLFCPAKPMADAAWHASRAIPTVIATVTDPVIVDYAVSLARPGKHITGVTTANGELIGKRLELLSELVPGLTRLGTPIDPGLLDNCDEELKLMEQAAGRLRIRIVQVKADALKPDVDAWVQAALREKLQAIVTAPMTTNLEIVDRMAAACAAAKLPFVHDVPEFAAQSLAVYGPDFEDIFRRAAGYVARILKGEKPAEMAIEEPRAFKLIVNAAHARMLGLTLSPRVLARADEVIE